MVKQMANVVTDVMDGPLNGRDRVGSMEVRAGIRLRGNQQKQRSQ